MSDNIDLKLLGKHVSEIRQQLREMRSVADIDRRNNRAHYDSLIYEVAQQMGAVDAQVEALVERMEERFDRIEELVRK